MTDDQSLTYSVIITITLPGDSGETVLNLKLGPADRLPSGGGSSRLLQDCTLADLQQFADSLEAEIWQAYLDSTLVDLVVDESLQIEFVYDESGPGATPSDNLLLDHLVLFPDSPEPVIGELPDETAQVSVADEPEVEVAAAEITPEELTEEEVSQAADKAPVEETADEIEPPEEELPAGGEDELLVTVAEPELVHEEREALPAPKPPVVRPPGRILGRRRPLGHSIPSAVDILMNESAFRDAQAHAISSMDREVAGVLVGPPPEKQPDGRYVVHISDMIIAKHTRMQGASVTYTPESWRYVNDRLAEMYPDDDAVIVGWYHTHPGFGIFLSGMDRFIHHNFFTQIWHVALVLDPRARHSGFFSWDRAKTVVNPYDFPWPLWAADSW